MHYYLYCVLTFSKTKKTHPLKLVAFTLKVPSVAAITGTEVSMFAAMLVLPHGEAVLGRWTSERCGIPDTPSTGAINACDRAWRETAKTMARTVKAFENMSITKVVEWHWA
jgi:hypothetical protein